MANANVSQWAFQFFSDDSTIPDDCTPYGSLNSFFEVDLDTTFIVRLGLSETAGRAANAFHHIQYDLNLSDSWSQVQSSSNSLSSLWSDEPIFVHNGLATSPYTIQDQLFPTPGGKSAADWSDDEWFWDADQVGTSSGEFLYLDKSEYAEIPILIALGGLHATLTSGDTFRLRIDANSGAGDDASWSTYATFVYKPSASEPTTVERDLSDSLTLTDSLVRTGVYDRSLADSASLSDTLVRTGVFDRSSSDSFAYSDTLTRQVTRRIYFYTRRMGRM